MYEYLQVGCVHTASSYHRIYITIKRARNPHSLVEDYTYRGHQPTNRFEIGVGGHRDDLRDALDGTLSAVLGTGNKGKQMGLLSFSSLATKFRVTTTDRTPNQRRQNKNQPPYTAGCESARKQRAGRASTPTYGMIFSSSFFFLHTHQGRGARPQTIAKTNE